MKEILVNLIFLCCITNLAFGKMGSLSSGLAEKHLAKSSADEIVPFDIYFNGESEKAVKMHLDNFAHFLKKSSDKIGYVISYAGRRAEKNESVSNLKKIKSYLMKKKRIEIDRLVFLDGGHRERGLTELFIVPKDSTKPVPSPTVDSKDVIIVGNIENECHSQENQNIN